MVFSGALIIAFAYSFRNGSGLAEACTAVLSVIGGPTLGLFTLGIFLPFVSQMPALIGISFGILISVWKYMGALYNPPGSRWTRPLALDTSMCTNATFEELPASAIFDDIGYENTAVNNFYHISYVFLGTIGLSTTLIFGLISALLLNKYQTGKFFTPRDKPPKGSTWNTRIRFEDKSKEYTVVNKMSHIK
jgi:sodium-coupled monocarboxylate transporter 8/12